MADPTLPPDQTATQWRDDAWLVAWPLSPVTALDYFAGSPFYERGCVNDIARGAGVAVDRLNPVPAGPEYVLASSSPTLYVIHRRFRAAPGAQPTPQAAYYILEGAVYQAPPLGAVLASRLDRCLWSIKAAFARVQADLDPLAAAERAAGDAAGRARPLPPARRYSEAERARAVMADRVIGGVLAGLVAGKGGGDEGKGKGGEGGEGGAEAMVVGP